MTYVSAAVQSEFTRGDVMDKYQLQARELRRLNGMTAKYHGYQYRLTYAGGPGCYVRIDRRQIGTRNYKHFLNVSCYEDHYWDTAHARCLIAIKKGV